MVLSVVIITWNAKHFLEKCLKSIYDRNIGFEFELIIIDNNSSDGSLEFIKSEYSNAILIENKSNRGVAPARNQGIKIAKGEYILILDVDTELLTENAFKTMCEYMDLNLNTAVLGAKLIFSDGALQHTCRKFPSIWLKMFTRFGNLPFINMQKMINDNSMVDYDHNIIMKVDYLIGAFQLVRKSIFDLIGAYDESIFYGPEDIDFCLRVKKNKYDVVYFPGVVLYHFYQRITKNVFSKITLLHIKGLFHFFLKHKYINYPKY